MTLIVFLFICFYFFYKQTLNSTISIADFNYENDSATVTDLIKNNWDFLAPLVIPEYSQKLIDLTLKQQLSGSYYPTKITIKVLKKYNQVIGFITFLITDDKKSYIELLAITPSERGHGYGTMLIKYAINKLKDQYAQFIDVFAYYKNTIAQNLYLGLGFKIIELTNEGQLVHLRKEL
jgi:ribosomal protein S18 acetylase RimI-like enzyme